MKRSKYFHQLNDRDLNILEDLYNYRAMTTKQIKRRYFEKTKYYVNKVLHNLRRENYIASKSLKGSRINKKGEVYHYLTENGLECLGRQKRPVKGLIQNLYVKPSQLHYILMVNDLMIDLEESGWKLWDSRRLKREYGLDSRMNILGLLKAPDGREYCFYILEEGALPTTLGKIQAEIRDHYKKVKNLIIFTNGSTVHENFINNVLNPSPKRIENKLVQQRPIFTGYQLKVMPYKMGILFYKSFPSREKWLNVLSQVVGFTIIDDKSEISHNASIVGLGKNKDTSVEKVRRSFNTIIHYNGKEMYLVDLVEFDLTLVQKINLYSDNDYQSENNRDLLVIRHEIFPEERINKREFICHYIFSIEGFLELIKKNSEDLSVD